MHPSEQYFYSELASMLQAVHYTLDALGQALVGFAPIMLVAALIGVVLCVTGCTLHSRPHSPDAELAVS